MRNVSDKTVEKIITRNFWSVIFSPKSCLLWDNVEKYTASRSHIAIQYGAYALHAGWPRLQAYFFPTLQQCLHESAPMLRSYLACLGLKCNIYQPLDNVSRDACNSCRCIAAYWVFSSNLYSSWNVVVQAFCDKPHDKIWEGIGFFGPRKSRGLTQTLSDNSEILNACV